MRTFLKLVVITACCAGCSVQGTENEGPGKGTFTDAAVSGDMVVVKPLYYDKPFRNPMMGWRDVFSPGLDPVPASYPLPYGSIYREYIPWNSIENRESDGVDKIRAFCNRRWKDIEKMNVKVIPRVYIHWLGTPPVDDPDRLDGIRFPEDIPYEFKEGEPYPLTGGYFHPTFQDRVRKLVAKLGEAWDNDPRVAYVEMGIVGQWSEHHSPNISTYWKPHDFPEHIENVTWIPGIEKTLGDAFTAAFKNKKVMVRYAYEFRDYQVGYDWDSWGIAQEDERGYAEMMKMGDRWKTHPYGGEICWNWGDFYDKFYPEGLPAILDDDQTRDKIIRYIRELHANHLGYYSYARPVVDFSSPTLARAAEVQMALGYRFVLDRFTYSKRAEPSGKFNISFSVRNIGSSPFYYDWPVEIALLDCETGTPVWKELIRDAKVNQWYPGDNWDNELKRYLVQPEVHEISRQFILPQNLKPGKYIVSVSIVDPAGNTPSLRFATMQYFTGGRHPMGYVGIGEDIGEYAMETSLFDNIYTDTNLYYTIENESENTES